MLEPLLRLLLQLLLVDGRQGGDADQRTRRGRRRDAVDPDKTITVNGSCPGSAPVDGDGRGGAAVREPRTDKFRDVVPRRVAADGQVVKEDAVAVDWQAALK